MAKGTKARAWGWLKTRQVEAKSGWHAGIRVEGLGVEGFGGLGV